MLLLKEISILALLSVPALAGGPQYASNLNDFLFNSDLVTDSIIIKKDGNVLLENYGEGYDENTKHIMWSVSKSFTNAVVGLAVKDGKLSTDQSICEFYPEFRHTQKCDVTIDHLLRYTAGFDWTEKYEPSTLKDILQLKRSDVFQMNSGIGNKDTANYVLSKSLKYEPGSTLQYNTGTPNALMGILKRIYGDSYNEFIQNRLFKKIGDLNYFWQKDGSGTNLGGSHLFTTPRTMLSFGEMYLNNGVINGEQVLDRSWIEYTRTQTRPDNTIEHQDIPGVDIIESIGALWWLNTPVNGQSPWPDAPDDTYIAWGHWSQFIIIIPSENVVIVRTGLDKKAHFDINRFIKLSLDYIKENQNE